jgi:hypothetical protein
LTSGSCGRRRTEPAERTCCALDLVPSAPLATRTTSRTCRAGYAEAVARLRDDERYRNWWTAAPERSFGTAYWAPEGRQHLADYLETVGPDGLDVTTGGLSRG